MRAEGVIGLEPKLLRAVVPAFIAGVGIAIFQVVRFSINLARRVLWGFRRVGSFHVGGRVWSAISEVDARFRVVFLDGSQGSLGSIEFEES